MCTWGGPCRADEGALREGGAPKTRWGARRGVARGIRKPTARTARICAQLRAGVADPGVTGLRRVLFGKVRYPEKGCDDASASRG